MQMVLQIPFDWLRPALNIISAQSMQSHIFINTVASLGLVSLSAVRDGVTRINRVWFLVFAVHRADDLFFSRQYLIVAHNLQAVILVSPPLMVSPSVVHTPIVRPLH
jgi:hypothetical protein